MSINEVCVTGLATQQPHKTIYTYLVTAQNNLTTVFKANNMRDKRKTQGIERNHREVESLPTLDLAFCQSLP